jgi:hypothetical protein
LDLSRREEPTLFGAGPEGYVILELTAGLRVTDKESAILSPTTQLMKKLAFLNQLTFACKSVGFVEREVRSIRAP